MSIKLHYDPTSEKRVIAEFCNGIPKNGTEFVCKAYQEKRQNDPKFKGRKVLLVKGQYVDYVGDNFTFRQSHPYAPKYALAKINRKTGTAEVFETDFYKLRPIVKTVVNKKTSQETNEEELDFAKKDEKLASVFGTAQLKASKLSIHRSNLSENTVTEDVDAIVKNDDFKVVVDDFSYSSKLLEYNQTAESVDEVYPLFDLIPMAVFNSVTESAQNFFNPAKDDFTKWKQTNGKNLGRYVIEHVQNPGDLILVDGELCQKYFNCLQFIICLVKIATNRQKIFSARSKVFLEMKKEVKNFFISSYFVTPGKTLVMPERLKDKVIATAIVLAWHLDSYSVDSEQFREAFDVTNSRFTQIVRALGGDVKNGRAKLSIPLKFPREFKAQKRISKLLKS